MKREMRVDNLDVLCYTTREEMGNAAAKVAAADIRNAYETKGEANLIFASSPSQMDVLNALRKEDVDWTKVNAFHMDEYIGLGIEHPSSFANYIRENFLKFLPLKNAFYLNGLAEDIPAECRRYAKLLMDYPTDITFAGIGENGHMAFNDPYLADFFEPDLVKVNPCLDDVCRSQQVHDGWFDSLDSVPSSAITLTFPALLRAPRMIITVPGEAKKQIVHETLDFPVSLDVPGSCARLHRNAAMSIDDASAALLRL